MEIDVKSVAEFIKYLNPKGAEKWMSAATPHFVDKHPPLYGLHTRQIASGERTHRTKWISDEYDGDDNKVSSVVKWMSQYDDEWEVDAGRDGELYVSRCIEVPYTEEEIAAAKAWVDANPYMEEYVRFRVPTAALTEWVNLPSEDEE